MRPSALKLLVAWLSSCRCRRVSVSGQSAGGSMAIQHLFAFSGSVDGAAIVGGSPYGCGFLPYRFDSCEYGGIDRREVIEYVYARAAQGLIDDPANLTHTPVVLFSGRNDWVVYRRVMKSAEAQLRAFVRHDLIHARFDTWAGHTWSVDHGACDCGDCPNGGSTECCDVNNCGYDLSGDTLRRAYGSVKPRARAHARLHWVDQWSYLHAAGTRRVSQPAGGGAAGASSGNGSSPLQPPLAASPSPSPSPSDPNWTLLKWGIAYVSSGCQRDPDRCRVHINYHGCMGGSLALRRRWVRSLDLNEYAESNDLIVLYPQAQGDAAIGNGCWNWAIYAEDPLFDTRDGVQLGMVHRLVEDLPNALRNAKVLEGDLEPEQPALEVVGHAILPLDSELEEYEEEGGKSQPLPAPVPMPVPVPLPVPVVPVAASAVPMAAPGAPPRIVNVSEERGARPLAVETD